MCRELIKHSNSNTLVLSPDKITKLCPTKKRNCPVDFCNVKQGINYYIITANSKKKHKKLKLKHDDMFMLKHKTQKVVLLYIIKLFPVPKYYDNDLFLYLRPPYQILRSTYLKQKCLITLRS